MQNSGLMQMRPRFFALKQGQGMTTVTSTVNQPKRVTIMGLGLFGGGAGAAKFWIDRGAEVTITDLRTEAILAPSLNGLAGYPCRFVLGEHLLADFTDTDLVIVNPAVKPDNPFVAAARKSGIPIDSEIGTLFQLLRGMIYGVTGSNGKSTTTSMLGSILREAFPQTLIGGNLGGSLLHQAENLSPSVPAVLELSSFQLYHLNERQVSPHVSIITNLTPNHLDWHGDEEAYYEAKRTILRYQKSNDLAILPACDKRIEVWGRSAQGRVIWYGLSDPHTPCAVFYRGKELLFRQNGKEQVLTTADHVKVPGVHNQLNAAGAAAAAAGSGISAKDISAGLASFTGLPHRLEEAGFINGIRMINDSISTTPESSIVALDSFPGRPLVLILGGYDKGTSFTALGARVADRCSGAVVLGRTAEAISAAIRLNGNRCPVHAAGSLKEAVSLAVSLSPAEGIVILSPACASYDMFINFEDRGHRFCQIVKEYGRPGSLSS